MIEQVTSYRTSDGTVYTTEAEARVHEDETARAESVVAFAKTRVNGDSKNAMARVVNTVNAWERYKVENGA